MQPGYQCPGCRTPWQPGEAQAGETVTCPACGHHITPVPLETGTATRPRLDLSLSSGSLDAGHSPGLPAGGAGKPPRLNLTVPITPPASRDLLAVAWQSVSPREIVSVRTATRGGGAFATAGLVFGAFGAVAGVLARNQPGAFVWMIVAIFSASVLKDRKKNCQVILRLTSGQDKVIEVERSAAPALVEEITRRVNQENGAK